MRHTRKVMFGILVLLLFAYSNEAQQGENHSLEALEKRVAKLEANVDLLGFSMRVDWAGKIEPPPPSLTRSEVAKWLETAASTFQQKTFSFPHKLEPGTWTFVELVLTPAPKKLGRIGFSQLQTPTVELLQRKE